MSAKKSFHLPIVSDFWRDNDNIFPMPYALCPMPKNSISLCVEFFI
ncbi:hypothetical protein FDUTEX481_03294 [Tolypothrix sp. PCC 7601]|nr:hypothetical protein FDUTEX481_03294 [Tolypothrix sp. PCC 7601]